MPMATAALGGSLWKQGILNALHTVYEVAAGALPGFPIAMRTRAVPTDKPVILTEATDGVLLDTFDSIPLYTNGTSDANDVDFLYPDGTWTDVVLAQE
jgi:hypothetical protein